MLKETKFYRAELPSFCGYGCYGYGTTQEQALTACKKAYQELKKDYSISSDNEDYGNFKRAWEYFGGKLIEEIAGHHAIYGSENIIDDIKL